MNLEQIEKNVADSFRLAKKDIHDLQEDVVTIAQAQEKIIELLETLRNNEMHLYNRVKEITVKKDPKSFCASKSASAKKFHIAKCPFAQNIKPANRVKFNTKEQALNQGLKPCNCII